MSLPKVSIIISAYNAEKYLKETLDCVLAQTWKNLEIIVVNDGSTDNTGKILSAYESKGIIKIVQENKGQDAALNAGYNYSTGDFIKFLDSDDLINPEMIAIQMDCLDGSIEHICYGEWSRFYNDDPKAANFTALNYWKDMSPIDFLTARPEGVMLQCGIMLMPRHIIVQGGLWDERLILFNDTEFFTRLILASKGIRFAAGARLYYRSGLSGSISASRGRKFYESTFLATNLIAEHLLKQEDSFRVRNLISNTFLNQYYQFYPKFSNLGKMHEIKIKQFGYGTAKAEGGKVFRMLSIFFGWKFARIIQHFFYKMGYLKLIRKR